MSENLIGNALNQLFIDINAKKNADINVSYSASLLNKGTEKCAKKLGEEAVEMAIALTKNDKAEIINEAADVLYHFTIALIAAGIDPNDIASTLEKRRGTSGIEEKNSRAK